MTLCYKLMNHLPPVPERFIQQALDIAESKNQEIISGHSLNNLREYRREIKKHGKVHIVRNNFRYPLGKEITQWIRENICETFIDVGVSTSTSEHGESDLQSPHTDHTRGYGLLYIIASSNTDQNTVFWQELGHPVHRERKLVPYVLDNLVQIDSVRIPLKTWYYLDGSILHSVENIKSHRIAIQVSFETDPLGIFI